MIIEPAEMDTESFKNACKAYSALGDEIAQIQSKVKEIKTAQGELGDDILTFMVKTGVSEVVLPDGSKICHKISKKTASINRQFLLAQLLPLTGGDAAAAERTLERIYESRDVEEKSTISRIKPRGKKGEESSSSAANGSDEVDGGDE